MKKIHMVEKKAKKLKVILNNNNVIHKRWIIIYL